MVVFCCMFRDGCMTNCWSCELVFVVVCSMLVGRDADHRRWSESLFW